VNSIPGTYDRYEDEVEDWGIVAGAVATVAVCLLFGA
jgi:hypothetical protein